MELDLVQSAALDGFAFQGEVKDERFGKIKLFEREGKILFTKSVRKRLRERLDGDIDDLKQRVEINHPNLLSLKGFQLSEEREQEQVLFKAEGIYEFPQRTLDQELEKRKRKNQFFSALELKTMLKGLLSISMHLENQSRIHGDIRPLYISLL